CSSDLQAPDLHEVLDQRLAAGDTHVILDGTAILTTRVAGKVIKTKGPSAGRAVHRWYSGKHRTFCGNIQFLATADGHPLWCSKVLPGGTHNDLARSEEHTSELQSRENVVCRLLLEKKTR